MEKEYIYVGYYYDTENRFILKIGTTNDLDRRRYEHNHNYRKSPNYTMPKENSFKYIWTHKLSKYNTLRYEDRNRELWQEMGIGEFVRNDRFVLYNVPKFVNIKIRKDYQIILPYGGDFWLFCLLTKRAGRGWLPRPEFGILYNFSNFFSQNFVQYSILYFPVFYGII